MKRTTLIATAVLATTVLASCSTGGASTTGSGSGAPAGGGSTAAADASAFLNQHGLAGLSGQQIVDKLDATEDDRASGPMGSVRPGQVIVTDRATGQELSRPLPEDKFYLAMAPYEQMTHECFNHNTATCKGELPGKTFHVTITDKAGKNLVDQDVTAYPNGFGSIWAPSGITDGTLTITYDGKKAVTPISTGPDDPTCLTTPLKLT